MIPLDRVFEEDGPKQDIPQRLETLYGGGLGFTSSRLYANFVSSLDGVVALEGMANSSQVISAKSEADRFVMGLLRSFADVVLIGAGTLRAAPTSHWTPAWIYPDAAAEFAELRRTLGRTVEPQLAVLTASGDLDPQHPALQAGALVFTTNLGAAKLKGRVSDPLRIVVLGDARTVDLPDVIATLRSEDHQVILTEGGPTLIGGILNVGLLDELFLTLSPILAGRSEAKRRPGFVEGTELLPSLSILGDLRSIRKHGSHLFLRYAMSR